MSRKLSAGLGAKVDQAKEELAFDAKVDEAQQKLKRKRVPKNFTIAKENAEWLDRRAIELSVERGERVTVSGLVNEILDNVKAEGWGNGKS